MLECFAFADNLYDIDAVTGKRKIDTLAEMYLKANQKECSKKHALLKKLGDTSLYISGFFSDSLKKKVVDIDYYINMGESAYSTLATSSSNQVSVEVFGTIAKQFVKFVDVLSYISQKTMLQTNADLLRLYDRYILTGSELARDQLIQSGFNLNKKTKKSQ